MAKDRIQYLCTLCDYRAPSLLGKCPECQAWGTFVEQVTLRPTSAKEEKRPSVLKELQTQTKPLPLDQISLENQDR
ncbi:MAG: DNA repair protein RadA, partial [Cyanobacteria bacterium]|nr:DNA repair protein RadA [Cyanobacteriota bacterium]